MLELGLIKSGECITEKEESGRKIKGIYYRVYLQALRVFR